MNSIKQNKINELKEYFKPHFDVFENLEIYCWIASGAIRSYFVSNKPKDVDFFFPNAQSMAKACEHLKKNNFKLVIFLSPSFLIVFSTFKSSINLFKRNLIE